MRIIDKNTDFYDYWQNVYKDDTFTFDRRNSFILTKEMVCNNLERDSHWRWRTKKYEYNKFDFALLQICNTFWLFLIEITRADPSGCSPNTYNVKDYNIELLNTWKNFDVPRELCDFKIIKSHYYWADSKEDIYKRINDFVRDINTNDYKIKSRLDIHEIRTSEGWVKKNIPLLKACGVANCVDAHDVYLAFEEYFALEKSSTERREPLGTTDIDKIESHGFDKKTSFRGKT